MKFIVQLCFTYTSTASSLFLNCSNISICDSVFLTKDQPSTFYVPTLSLEVSCISFSSSNISYIYFLENSEYGYYLAKCSVLSLGFGGLDFFISTSYQFTDAKNGCLYISTAPSGPAPNLFVGFLFKSDTIKFLASVEIDLGNLSGPFIMLLNNSSLLPEKYGGVPTNISYKRTPRRYQSTLLPWPTLLSISGAKYAIEPQNDFAPLLTSRTPSFDNPKSVNKAWPSSSSTTLSGFRSL